MWGHKVEVSKTLYRTGSSVGDTGQLGMAIDYNVPKSYTWTSSIVSDGIHGTPNLSSESRPKNITMNYIIKI